jgi:hypothetical protein
MNKIKVIYLVDNFFSKRDYKRFLVKDLIKYFQVEIFNFIKLYYIDAYKQFKKNKINYKKKINLRYKNSLNLNKKFLNQKNIFFDLLTNQNKNNFIFKLKNSKIIQFQGETVPKERFFYKILNHKIRLKTLITIFRNLKSFFIKKLIKKSVMPDLIFITGLATENVSAKKIIYSHSFDYELYLNSKKNIYNNKYIVFLDELMFDHPDYLMHKTTPPMNESKYFKYISEFFFKIKNELNLDVLVAAHPRLIYLPNLGYYKKFNLPKKKVIVNNTINLVKDCSFVLAHASTSISFAILYKKPIVFLNFREFSWMRSKVQTARYLTGGTEICLDDNLFSLSNYFVDKIDKNKYQDYLNNYIKHPKSTNKSMVIDLISYIKSI